MTTPADLVALAKAWVIAATVDDCEYRAADEAAAESAFMQAVAALKAVQWQPIETHDGGTTEVIGMDGGGLIFRTWFFAPSSQTKNWLRCGSGKPWKPLWFMPIPAPPTAKP